MESSPSLSSKANAFSIASLMSSRDGKSDVGKRAKLALVYLKHLSAKSSVLRISNKVAQILSVWVVQFKISRHSSSTVAWTLSLFFNI